MADTGTGRTDPILVSTTGKGLLGRGGEILEAVGTWTAEPVLSDEDYEYVDDNMEETVDE